jgi:uncharacterized protein (DUF1697 family)
MARYVALLRAVNVGGTGKLPMAHLKKVCCDAGFDQVETYIASGNVVFASGSSEAGVKAALEARLLALSGKRVAVIVRTAAEMRAVLEANPFPEALPKYTVAIFLDKRPPPDALRHVAGRDGEEIGFGKREIFVHYASGMARSKLRIPAAAAGTARNMNTVARLAEMASRI